MPDPQRLEFVTRHFRDLQRIRLLPIQLVMTLALVEHRPAVSVPVAWTMLCGFLLLVVGFFWWSTVAIRRRYGAVKLSRAEELRMRSHPVIVALYVILAALMLWYRHVLHSSFSNLYMATTVLIFMLSTILDPTNIRGRRIAYAIGTVVLFAMVPLTIDVRGGAMALTIIVDFLLLRRAFTGVSV